MYLDQCKENAYKNIISASNEIISLTEPKSNIIFKNKKIIKGCLQCLIDKDKVDEYIEILNNLKFNSEPIENGLNVFEKDKIKLDQLIDNVLGIIGAK